MSPSSSANYHALGGPAVNFDEEGFFQPDVTHICGFLNGLKRFDERQIEIIIRIFGNGNIIDPQRGDVLKKVRTLRLFGLQLVVSEFNNRAYT